MRLVILNQFFYPDHSATSQLMTELAESLVERGLFVTALAGRGRYNGGDKLSRRDVYRGVRIARAWATSFGKSTTVGRILDYLSFYIGATWTLLRLPAHDAIMSLTTPPLIGVVALLIGRLRGMRVIMLVQDVYPDIAVALGALRPSSPMTRLLAWISGQMLKKSDRIVVLSDCMRRRILERIGSDQASRIDVIHNWADGADICPVADSNNPFVNENNLSGAFVVLFSGNFGRVNEFSTVLEAARLLRNRPEIVFLFIGGGARENEIREFSRSHGLENIKVLPYQPKDRLRYSLAAGDALLVTVADGLAGLCVPSKTYAIMAAGKPLLFVGDTDSDIARLISDHNCGAVVPAGEGYRLMEVITRWSESRSELQQLGSSARSLFEERFSREQAVKYYLESLAKCYSLESTSNIVPQQRDTAIKDTAS